MGNGSTKSRRHSDIGGINIRRKTGIDLTGIKLPVAPRNSDACWVEKLSNGESPPLDSDSLDGLVDELEDTSSMMSPMSTDRSEVSFSSNN